MALPFSPKNLLLLFALWGALPLHADFPKPIAPPKSEVPAKIGTDTPPLSSGPLSQTRHFALPALIERMNSNALSPQQAWDDKLINLDDLLWIFTSYIDPWGRFAGKKNEKVRRQLAGLLAEHGGEKLQPMEKLPPTVRLWLADYYQAIKDERCVALCESILHEIKASVKDESALVFQSIERLGWFYRNVGQYEKSGQSWLRMKDYHDHVGWWIPDSLVAAARQYKRAGNQAKAQELYAQVPAFGNGWFTGLALYDQAEELVNKGQHIESRKLLLQEVKGDRAETIQVALWALLSSSYYATGEFNLAQEYAKSALNQYKTLRNPPTDLGFKLQISIAEKVLEWSEKWLKQPFFVERRVIVGSRKPGQEVTAGSIYIRSSKPLPFSIQTSDPRVKVQQATPPEPKLVLGKQFYFEQEVTWEWVQQKDEQNLKSKITISSPEVKEYQDELWIFVF
jgi:tetratricopeptide (TPR) repeat protein